jgi:hypothetical protein
MPVTHRKLIGAIANNPANFEGDGEWRYIIREQDLYFAQASKPDPRNNEQFIPIPSLNPDGSKRMEHAFQQFIKRRWLPSRQAELARFAEKRGWNLAMELRYGGGALEDKEAEEWQFVVNRELERLAAEVRQKIEEFEKTE